MMTIGDARRSESGEQIVSSLRASSVTSWSKQRIAPHGRL